MTAVPPPPEEIDPADAHRALSAIQPEGCWVWPGSLDEIVDGQVQDVFDRLGPERDRHTDWRKCADEPWASLAQVLAGDALIDWLCEVEL